LPLTDVPFSHRLSAESWLGDIGRVTGTGLVNAPGEFRIDRNPKHLAVGVGPHFCLGASLARMELQVLFSTILRRMTGSEYTAGGPVIAPSALVRDCTEMRISHRRR
jgi:cytochrome P450